MPALATAANTAWLLGNLSSARRFRRALSDPASAQRAILFQFLRDNADTLRGTELGFASVRTVENFQRRIPITTHDDYLPFIQRLARGGRNILTREPVRRFAPTSGSTRAEKWIPYTRTLMKEFSRGIAPWITNLFHTYPALRRGPAYWSISPAVSRAAADSQIPVGFDDDSAYLGGFFKRIVDATLAVPGEIMQVTEMPAFRYLTLLSLLRCRELRLISVWHPSFLTLLLYELPRVWDRLLADVRAGTVTPPASVDGDILRTFQSRATPDPHRADELRHLGVAGVANFWPHLTLLSCWTDAGARNAAAGLQKCFPQVTLQGKGLLSTEGFVSLPYVDRGITYMPLAIRSHFFEFVPDDGTAPRLAENLDIGGIYTFLLTTGGGLCRYNTHDRIRVTGRLMNTPCIEFLGKEDLITDLRGEKLNAIFVASVLADIFQKHALETTFGMLAPDTNGISYTLFIETPHEIPPGMAIELDERLSQNPHYAWCRQLGQLAPARIFKIATNAQATYFDTCRENGQRLGDIKLTPLHRGSNWREIFVGSYIALPKG